MKETSIPPGCKLEMVHDVLMAFANRFGKPVYTYFNDYYVDSTMYKEEIVEGYRKHWDSKHKELKSKICTQ